MQLKIQRLPGEKVIAKELEHIPNEKVRRHCY